MAETPTRNRAQCLLCHTVIESRFRHDFQLCRCGAIFVDGGTAYFRYGTLGDPAAFRRLDDDEEPENALSA